MKNSIFNAVCKTRYLALLVVLIFTCGNVWGAAEIVYTLDGTTTGGSAGYDVASDIEQDEISWKVTGNTTMNPWRLGGKGGSSKNSTSNLTRTIYNTDPIADDITSIVIKTGTKTLNALTNINVKVTTGSNGSGTVKQTFTETLQASHTYTFDKPAGQDWSDCYYLITFTFQAKGTSNQYIQFLSADFYAETSSCEKITTAPTVTATPGDMQISLSWPNQSEASSYSVTCTGGTVGAVTGTSTKSCTISSLTNGTSYTWTVTPVGDGSTYCTDGNTAASASATPNVFRTITYYDKDGQHTTSLADGTNIATALTALYGGDDPVSCDATNYEYFVGWKVGEISGTASSVTLLDDEVVNASSPSSNYYAVWSDTDPDAGGWEAATSIAAGDVLVLCNQACTYELNGISTTSTNYGILAAVSNKTPANLYPLTVEAGSSDGTFSFKNGSHYLSWSSGNSLTKSTTKDANSSWTVSINSSGVATIRNASDAARYLQYNATSRFACYANTMTDPSFFKESSSGDAEYITTCCTKLNAVNGSVAWTNPSEAVLTWDNVANVSSWAVTCNVLGGSAAGIVGSITTNGSGKKTCTITGLACNTNYDFTITGTPTSSTYCEASQTLENQNSGKWSVSYSLSDVTKTSGPETGANVCGDFSAVFEATNSKILPAAITVQIGGVTKTAGTDYTWDQSTGALSIASAKITGAISITITGTAPAYAFWYGEKGQSWTSIPFASVGSGEHQITGFVMPNYEYEEGLGQMYWNVAGSGITATNREFYAMSFAQTQSSCGNYDYYNDGTNNNAWIRGAAAGAKGTLRIYDYKVDNGWCAFIPDEYILKIGTSEVPFIVDGSDANVWETALTTLSTLNGGSLVSTTKYRVGVGDASHHFVQVYNKCAETNISSMGRKTGAGDSWATDLTTVPAAQGKFRIWINNCTNGNWECHFVPYYQITYDANGGGGSMAALPATPVSCEETVENRTVTVGACTFTAPTGKEFKEWNTQADGNGTTIATGSRELTGDLKLYAIWKNESYSISATMTNVTSVTSFPVAYTYTGSAANVTYTFAASSGYRLPDAVTVTGSTYTWDKTTGELTLTGTITGNVSITISGTQTHTVTWKYNGSDYVSPVTYDHGASLVLPTPNPTAPSGCSSKVFVGWTARNSEIDTETSTKPTLINPASPGTVTGDVTYRAVFADEVTSTTTVIRYLYTTSISTGKNYIIASSNSAGSVNTATYTGTGNAFTNTSMTVVSGTPNYIAAPANNNAVWSVAAGSASGKYYIQNVGNAGNYIRINGSAANISTDQTDVYFDSDHGVFGKSGSGSTSYSFYYSSGWVKGTFSTSNRNYIFVATEVEVETTTTDKYITLCSTCTTPSNVTAGNISSTGATISWDGVSIEEQTGGSGTGFVVKYGTNAIRDNNNNTVTATSSESSKALTGLTPATQYYAWVQSKCDNSWSETPASFHTAAKITYDKNGGTGTNTSEDVTYNSNVTIKTIATLGFEAPSGKTFNGWLASSAVTVGGSSTTSVADGATISNLTAAITLTAQWRDLNTWDITFNADNGTIAGGSPQVATEGFTFTFPNVTSTTCGTFIGWITSSSYSSATKPASFVEAGATEDISIGGSPAATTYYAVYAEATDPEPTEDYVLIENEQNDWSGDYLIVVSYDDSGTPRNRAMDGSLATLDATSNYQDVIISSKTITSNATTDGYKFTIAKVAGQPGKYSIQSAHGEYMGSNGDNTASKPNEIDQSSTLTADLYNTISYNSTESRPEILGSNANPLVLTYNKASGQTRFRYMTAVSTAIQVYKKGGGSVYTYKTSPSCTATVSTSTPASSFTYVYGNGPSASQTFQVSGSNLSANLVVTAPSNYEVSADNSSFSSSINIAPSGDGRVATTTVYIRLSAGLNVGTYSGGVITVSSTGADNDVSGTLTGNVTKATGTFTWTDFNAVDHYEGELTGASVAIPYNYTYVGDGTVSLVRVGGYGTVQTGAKTYTLTAVGEFQLRAEVSGGVNYTNPANTLATFIVYKADRFYDNIHADVQEYVSITLPIVERGSYVAPDLMDADKGSANCAAKHYKFMGWVSEANITAGLPNDDAYKAVLIPAGTPMTATGTNYYAVWAEDE